MFEKLHEIKARFEELNGLLMDHYPDSEEAILIRESRGGDR